eukprot:TRINITY_DN7173_c0_g1_i2.p1 TRINITY_DN7173_c0_g1~~TRINITY_DN7173_c0_g1_i2.p1  ORF type:complete len:682 (+),score=25.65 TRINITY_DN7173_c0_g1_i2:232-2277(+)
MYAAGRRGSAAFDGQVYPAIYDGSLSKYSIGKGPWTPKNWKERHFFADADALRYYAHENVRGGQRCGEPKGEIYWRDVVQVYETVDSKLHREAVDRRMCYFGVRFRDSGKSRLLLLRSSSESDRHGWLQAFSDRMGLRVTSQMVAAIEDEEEIDRPPEELPLCARRPEDDDGRRRDVKTAVSAIQVLKGLVSKKKKRFVTSEFNLDLVYVSGKDGAKTLIAMGYPASGSEALYRNSMDEVERFFTTYHLGAYKVYNLCSEKSYIAEKLEGRWVRFGFEDHNPPPLSLLPLVLGNIDEWLSRSPRHVAAVHCKAGKGRTGTVLCAYCGHSPESALTQFGGERTQDGKGVTIPSQKRYVAYAASLRREGKKYYLPTSHRVLFHRGTLSSAPRFDASEAYFQVSRRRRAPTPDAAAATGGPAAATAAAAVHRTGTCCSSGSPQLTIGRDRTASAPTSGSASRRASLPLLGQVPAAANLAASLGDALARGRDLLRGPETAAQEKGPWEVVYDSRHCCSFTKNGQDGEWNFVCMHDGASIGGGDLRFTFYAAGALRDTEMFHFWLHTGFVPLDRSPLVLRKEELDGAHKDKHNACFDEDFRITLEFSLDSGTPGTVSPLAASPASSPRCSRATPPLTRAHTQDCERDFCLAQIPIAGSGTHPPCAERADTDPQNPEQQHQDPTAEQ